MTRTNPRWLTLFPLRGLVAIIYNIQLYSHCMDNTTVCNDIILCDACFRKVTIKYNNYYLYVWAGL